MSELFDDEEAKEANEEEEFSESEDIPVVENHQRPGADARRRLESLLEEKRLRDELEDFLDY